MAKKQKYYVVWQGHKPGIYDNWAECQLQIKSYPNAKYKSFEDIEKATLAFRGNYNDHIGKTKKQKSKAGKARSNAAIVSQSIAVDAACAGNPGDMEYQGVQTIGGEQIFHQGPFKEGTNNVGEFLALVHALGYLKNSNDSTTAIYTDSRTAMAWVRNKKVKTNLKKSPRNEILFDLMERAINWLDANQYSNPILKWDTANWGEIPADFGRK